MNDRMRNSYIPTLDGWRAIAVCLVIAAHSQPMLRNSQTAAGTLIANLLVHTGFGVDIFFALSGYLICTLLLQEKARTGTISLGRFYTRRVFRILPPILLYLATLLTLVKFGFIPQIPTADFLRVLFFARNYYLGPWYTGHFWSLAVEEHFYLVAPVFFLLLPWRRALRIALLLVLVCIGIRWYEFSHLLTTNSLPQFRTENRFDALLWGGILALVLQSTSLRKRAAAYVTGTTALATSIAAAMLLNVVPGHPFRRTVVAMALPILISYTVLHPDRWFGRLLENKYLRWLGRISYSLYIWQMPFLVEGERPLGLLQSFPLALVLPFLCAVASYYCLEKPMIRIGHQLAASPGETPNGRFERPVRSRIQTLSPLTRAGVSASHPGVDAS